MTERRTAWSGGQGLTAPGPASQRPYGGLAGELEGGAGKPVAQASPPASPGPSLKSPVSLHPAVFLDRDGTINEEMGYINHISRFVLLPQAAAAICRLNQAGVKVVVVTNQSGAARGYFRPALVEEVHTHMQNLLAMGRARVDAIYTCLHGPTDGCPCRKPKPGLILEAARDLHLDLARSYLVGDRHVDVQTAANAGVKGVLVLTGYGRGEYAQFAATWEVKPVHVAPDLLAAVSWILKDLGKSGA
jgi:D-glycero-D-manno-heptose 1,7-bisphosphate phosphatase